ncbi:hypothetical protein C9374_009153 [Naegleria lovaniensis]|uniref:Uncharacterized protein n=1 Tax=Naegleria lovaniensis TaxID=51637 RepID=A0AA88KEM7_NAELO|nr:uncharacterized protein C9374_009153 [Naegleria lovaniensis]KAG2377637.1 hypothetical protein C9374_009153 [Naegleria lovaniensis]
MSSSSTNGLSSASSAYNVGLVSGSSFLNHSVIYENFSLQGSSNNKFHAPICQQWHRKYPLLAISKANGVVSVYDDHGEKLERVNLSRSSNCTALAWHPSKFILCTGWKDGALLIYNDKDHNQKEVEIEEHGKICALKWTPDGERLISTHQDGTIGVWKYEGGKLKHVVNYENPGSCVESADQIVFKTNRDPTTELSWIFFLPVLAGQGSKVVVGVADDLNETTHKSASGVRVDTLHDTGIQFNGSQICSLLFHREKSNLVLLTDTALLVVYKINASITKPNEIGMKQVMRTKISISNGSGTTIKTLWVGSGAIATITSNENMIRVWNLETDENTTLMLSPNNDGEIILSFSFNPQKRAIVGGTSLGRLVFWTFTGNQKARDQWEKYGEYQVPSKQPVRMVQWGHGERVLCYVCGENNDIEILQENNFQRRMKNSTVAIQNSLTSVIIGRCLNNEEKIPPLTIKTGINIRNFDHTETHLVVSNNSVIELFEHKGKDLVKKSETFEIPSICVGLHSESIFVPTDGSANSNPRIEVYSFKGVKKQTLQLSEEEGIPTSIDVQGDFITIATNTNHVRMWHVLGREAKPVSVSKKVFDNNENDQSEKTYISSVKCNCNGTMLALLGKIKTEGEIDLLTPSTKLYVYDFEHDRLQSFDFETKFKGGTPTSVFWDLSEPNLLSVELKNSDNEVYICTLFATQEHGTLFQDYFKIDRNAQSLVGQSVPNLFFVKNDASGSNGELFEKRAMKDFEGIDEDQLSSKTKRALLNFSFYLNIGSMEEAYKSVKQIESKSSIWYNMAKMCVKTRKMEISEICLGNMKNALAAKALRKVKDSEPNEPLAWIATLAIQLGMIDEAEKLYAECERNDLLNEMYQSIGQWEKALEVAKTKDRIHLKTTYYKYARYLEQEIGDLKLAEKFYELSNTHKYEVPRMYYNAADMTSLQNYILTRPEDKELNRWWAQYCEGNTDYEEALKYYIQSNDFLSQVRMYCFIGNLKMAADIVKKSQDKSAAYYFAKQLEHEKDNKKLLDHAIKYYKFAGCFNEAVRVAKLLGNDNEALNLSLQSSNEKLMIDVAHYFESTGQTDKAVLLYQKGGNLSRAIDLCFKHQLFDTLSTIADNIFNDKSDSDDPEVFMKCGQFFIEHSQFERAVQMYIRAKEYELALELCIKKNVKLTEEMADQMSPPSEEIPTSSSLTSSNSSSSLTSMSNNESTTTNTNTSPENEETNEKILLLRKIAKVASIQGSYAIATKKYVQAGDKLKAMKVLIKSGDTEKIMLFAVLSRQKQLYILAANYLQSLDWHNEPEIIKSIISFYTKAKAWKFLSSFFETCSQVEIDEYRDYEKALDALRESVKYLTKEIKQNKKSNPNYDLRLKQLNQKIFYIEKFILAKSLMNLKTNEVQFVSICRELINNVNNLEEESVIEIDEAIRVGDVFAILIEYHLQTLNDPNAAYKLILEMKQKDITLNYFLDEEMIKSICKHVGVDFNEVMPPEDNHSTRTGEDEDIQEEIEED